MPQSENLAIAYAKKRKDGLAFLQSYFTGNFDSIRKNWPDCPKGVFSPEEIESNKGVVYTITTKVISVACPHCRTSLPEVQGDPRGNRFLCGKCEKKFMVAEAAELEVA